MVLGSLTRVLAVVSVCVAAFIYRAGCILYLVCTDRQYWPCGMLLPYYLISEVVPAVLLILLYLMPGVEAACAQARERSARSARPSARPSMLESEVSAGDFSLRLSGSNSRLLDDRPA
ncbi:unnamed protein product [Effrenium voratum]|nr:unnamed protein product [Effrenium voratum]